MSHGADSDAPTLDQLLAAARRRLGQITEYPAQEARWLAEHALACTTSALIVAGPLGVATDDRARLHALVERRAAGEPLAYVLGRAPFWDFDLVVSSATLVPRVDTETLVQAALDHLDARAALDIVDLGTGSGAVALALARERARWRLVATDASESALAIAKTNAERLDSRRVEFRAGTWYGALAPGSRFDAIVSNPPYIAADDAHLTALAAEPTQALVSADDGLADLFHLIDQAADYLRPGGWLFLEHGWRQHAPVARRMRAQGFIAVETRADGAGNARVTYGRTPIDRTADTPAAT